MSAPEYAAGFESAQREIAEGLSPEAAARYLARVSPREGDAFDAGHRAAMVAHAAKVRS